MQTILELTNIDIQAELGAHGAENNKFEVFLTVKRLEHYRYRMMFVEYGSVAYPATAFAALSDATSKALYDIYKQNPSYFVKATKIISTKEPFRNYYSIPLRDFNTAGVVCAHLERLLSSMKQGYYKVYGIDVKVNSEKIQECLNAIEVIVDRL